MIAAELQNGVMEILQGWTVAHADERHLTIPQQGIKAGFGLNVQGTCLLYTSDAADEE